MNTSTFASEIVYPVVIVQECSCLASMIFLLFFMAPLAICFTTRSAPPPVVVQATPAAEKV